MVRLSILDQSVALAGRPHGESIRNTIALARHCEALGYDRFWVSEHHNSGTIVGTAPEILIAAIAATTTRIRVGAAGIMLPHYSPLKVAEQFRVLDAIAPGRIDLGLGRAPGSDGLTAFALHPMANERHEYFPADTRDLLAWISGQPLMEKHPFAAVTCQPQGETVPEVWMLGSSNYGAQVAAHFGLPYAFAWFFTNGRGGPEALQIYRQHYQPSARWPEPHAGLCVWALCADTDEEAEFLYASRARTQLLRERGVWMPIDPPEKALAYPYTDAERAKLAEYRERAMIGTAPKVAAQLRALAEDQGVAEIAVVTWMYDEAKRRRSYELLAREFGLNGAALAEPPLGAGVAGGAGA
jgi:luciferase family oxidoreductase group 1